jgi:hypothetical protein
MAVVKVAVPSAIDNSNTSSDKPPMLCSGLFQLEQDIKAYIDNAINFGEDGTIEFITLKDVQIDGISIVDSDQVANIPKASSKAFGVIRVVSESDGSYRLTMGDGSFTIPALEGAVGNAYLSRKFIPKATATSLGAVIAGDNITIDDNGRISAVAEQQEFLTISELDEILI